MTEQTKLKTDLLDDLLDATLDDLADIPEFKLLPEGAHKVKLNWRTGVTLENVRYEDGPHKGKLKQFIELKTTYIAVAELVKPEETPPEVGAENKFLYDLKNEFSQGKFKMVLNGLSAIFPAASNREVMAASENGEVTIVVKHTEGKKGSGRTYVDIIEVLPPM